MDSTLDQCLETKGLIFGAANLDVSHGSEEEEMFFEVAMDETVRKNLKNRGLFTMLERTWGTKEKTLLTEMRQALGLTRQI